MKGLEWYFKINLLVRILLGLILGAIAGLIFGPKIVWVSPLGDIFVRLLKMIVMPVVMFTLIVERPVFTPPGWGVWASKRWSYT